MSQGRSSYHVLAQTALNSSTGSSDPSVLASINQNVDSLGVFSPWFGQHNEEYPKSRAYAYIDSYAIYTTDAIATEHPEWILKGPNGQKLYIDYQSNGVLTEYAGDFTNPAFVAYQIARMQALVGIGYNIWLDDVNLAPRITDGTTKAGVLATVLPEGWSAVLWGLNMAQYTAAIRAALPRTTKIIHNALWMPSINSAGVMRQVDSCDAYYLERGYSGVTAGGASQWGLAAFMKYIDAIHSLGVPVIMGDYSAETMQYSLAGYLLTNDGADSIGFDDMALSPWPALLSLDLGAANGRRFGADGLWQRVFAQGEVWLLEPGASLTTLEIPEGMTDISGNQVNGAVLKPGTALILKSQHLASRHPRQGPQCL